MKDSTVYSFLNIISRRKKILFELCWHVANVLRNKTKREFLKNLSVFLRNLEVASAHMKFIITLICQNLWKELLSNNISWWFFKFIFGKGLRLNHKVHDYCFLATNCSMKIFFLEIFIMNIMNIISYSFLTNV